MRTMIFFMLLASVAAPALSQRDDDQDLRRSRSDIRAAIRAERAEGRVVRIEREQSSERPARVERTDSVQTTSDQPQAWRGSQSPERPDRPQRTQEVREERRGWRRGDRPVADSGSPNAGGDSVRNWRPRNRGSNSVMTAPSDPASRGLTQEPRNGDIADRRFRRTLERRFGDRDGRMNDGRPYDGVWRERVRGELAVSTTPRFGTQPPLRVDRERRNWAGQWSRHWRDDRRFDWRHHRDRNRSIFRVGFYYDPFGWNYQRYNIGWRMWPSYYGQSHWLSDPWRFRLPPAYPGTQWIRYHGDAILVDTWSGEVIDVIHDFFW